MTREEAIENIRSVSTLDSDDELQRLAGALDFLKANPPVPLDGVESIFELFERFPDEDGYGLFWTALHLVEQVPEYEEALLASVRRRPCEFNLGMVNALLNAGIEDATREDLLSVVASLSHDAMLSDDVREQAQEILKRHCK